jgi:dolichol-phosphate mannosyltransferase
MRSVVPSEHPLETLASPAVRVPALRESTQAVVVLPTLNEELGLERTLSEMPFDRFGDPSYPVEAIVIDGHSTDGTLDVARKWDVPVLHQTTRGKGAAVLEAVRWVHEQGVPHVALLDADATYPPQSLVPALNLLREGTDLVIGVRRPVGGPPRSLRDLVHRIGNVALSYTASAVSGRTILDVCSGFWAVSTEQFTKLGIGTTEFAIEAELILKSLRADLRVAQIPIDYRERLGRAKIRAARDGAAILLSIFQFGRGLRPPWKTPHVPGVPGRQILSIGLIAESRKAVLEYPPNDVQLANRLGFLLQQSLPRATVRVRPAPGSRAGPGSNSKGSGARCILITLPAPGGDYGAPPLSVLIRPGEKELTVRLSPGTPDPASLGAWGLARYSRPDSPGQGRPRSDYLPGLGAVTSRVGFEPGQLQRTILRANGFEVRSIRGTVAATFGGRP